MRAYVERVSESEHSAATLLERLQAETGLEGDAAGRMARAVVSVLLEDLPSADRASLLSALPFELRSSAVPSGSRPTESLSDFYERVAAREGAQRGFALEHAQSVCRALAETLPYETRRFVASRLPDALAPLFELPEGAASFASPPRVTSEDHTLAGGKPGSRKPLAESAVERAHTHSVARSGNPHGDSKMSSSHGETQEREGETLASGEPGPDRPLGGR